jgi:hypothetical protein
VPVLNKIDKALEQWEKSNPTVKGRLIIQMVIGGMTQYLTKVQGMPKHIEKRLTRRIRTFYWKDQNSTLHAPLEIGGQGLLESRNKAIQVMWLKSYLNFGPDTALWAKYGDALFAIKVPQGELSEISVRENTLFQSWSTLLGFQTKVLSAGQKFGNFGTQKKAKVTPPAKNAIFAVSESVG